MLSREDKKAIKRARREEGRFDNLAEVGNVGDLEQLLDSSRALADLADTTATTKTKHLTASGGTSKPSLRGSLRALGKR